MKRRKDIDKRILKIRGITRELKNTFLRTNKTPSINITGKWLIVKGFRPGEEVIMETEYEKITLVPKKRKEEPSKWE